MLALPGGRSHSTPHTGPDSGSTWEAEHARAGHSIRFRPRLKSHRPCAAAASAAPWAATRAPRAGTMPVSVFISYAHEDRAWCERLLDHLGWLRHSGQLAVFDDQQLKAGERWDERIRAELADAAIVVPLISPSFIGSRYCSLDELLAALQAGKRLVPVLVDHVDLAALPVAAIQCLPQDERQDLLPLVDWPNANRALAAIAAVVRKVVGELGGDAGPGQSLVPLERREVAAL